MNHQDRAGTGISGLDKAIDYLRLGDNVVWQVDSVFDYQKLIEPFVRQTHNDKRRLVYVRFGSHAPLLDHHPDITEYDVDPGKGFEHFAGAIHQMMEREGRKTFYVFDCLTDLLANWHSDLMIGNFFKVTCPYLFDLDTIAYFALRRNMHTNSCIAGIRETTQLLLDVYHVRGNRYIHPLKVWQRYSPTMFFPHLIRGEEAVSVTSSAEAAGLFSGIPRPEERLDNWDVIFRQAREVLEQNEEQHQAVKRKLLRMLVGQESAMFDLCDRYFSLADLIAVASREIGSGFIGGKSVGMLLARKILETEDEARFAPFMEPHDSFYVGSDVFYTYVVRNGWWKLRTQQKTDEGYFSLAPDFRDKLLSGTFPPEIREEFLQMLEYFGQSPIIVRSSSLLEDNFGNAFAGKYESVFCANQGSIEERYEAFESAIRTVYASTMNRDALMYRKNRGLSDKDEQMAVLVQRVSGDRYDDLFFPHVAGVGNSSNLYVWDKNIDMEAGMLRLVFGLGTRAVDRTVSDYARLVTLDRPKRLPPMYSDEQQKFAQRQVDAVSLSENAFVTRDWQSLGTLDLRADKALFATIDYQTEQRMRSLGQRNYTAPYLLDFQGLLESSPFPGFMRDMLALLSKVYEYPVDVEFTANFTEEGAFKVNLVQCRPLQTRGLGRAVSMPEQTADETCLIRQTGNFMGGNVHLPIDHVVYVDPQAYRERREQDKFAVARQIGKINALLRNSSAMLVGPGRWGTTTASLGVPVHFSELSHMSVICEVSSTAAGFMPELSYGSHFFQDLVETGIFYIAVFDGRQDVIFNPEIIHSRDNLLTELLPEAGSFSDVIHVARTEGLQIYSDVMTQQVVCR
ncbi:PEP/pyruvate-binding domain-containing protein [Balneolales bacterium ANBcel1]|nr:PEP/pyruvate-binding domain-containing protein [Balneolales bacterium ANBcel1]